MKAIRKVAPLTRAIPIRPAVVMAALAKESDLSVPHLRFTEPSRKVRLLFNTRQRRKYRAANPQVFFSSTGIARSMNSSNSGTVNAISP